MAYKALLFGVDDIFNEIKPFYEQAIQRGVLEVVAVAVNENDTIKFVMPEGELYADFVDIDIAIISSQNDFYRRMKQLESMGVPRDRIIDGRIFPVSNLDFPRLLAEGVAYGSWNSQLFPEEMYSRFAVCPRIYANTKNSSLIKLGIKSNINGAFFDGGEGAVIVGNFSSISWAETFEFLDGGHNPAYGHHYDYVSTCDLSTLDWEIPFANQAQNPLQILIGNDVWIGRGCKLKCTNPNKPLVISDGAVIAADSVVVKNVPPYAIVGGNPAQIIKYRFEPHIIDALLRIKWWDWSIDKIHDNFKYFNDVEKFVALHDN